MSEEKKMTGVNELSDEDLDKVSGGSPLLGTSAKGFTLNSNSNATMNGTAASTAELKAESTLKAEIVKKRL